MTNPTPSYCAHAPRGGHLQFPNRNLVLPRLTLRHLFFVLLLSLVALSATQAQTSSVAPRSVAPAPEAAELGQAGADTQALIKLLEDDTARARLIERLRADTPAATADPAAPVLVRSIAEHTRALTEQASGVFLLGNDAIRRAGTLARDMDAGGARQLGRSCARIAGRVAVTLLAYWMLCALSVPVMSTLDRRNIGRGLPHRLLTDWRRRYRGAGSGTRMGPGDGVRTDVP